MAGLSRHVGTTGRSRVLVRLLAAAAVVVGLLLGLFGTVTTASPATASPRGDILDCGDTDAPMPASPYGDGSFIVRPSTAETELPKGYDPGQIIDATDPFRSPEEVSLESAYGTAPRWWVYETGCTGRFVAGAGTALANIELQVAGILPSWSHALLDTVVGDSELFSALDKPVKASTEAVSEGVWGPWLPVVLMLVAGLVLWRARSGRLGGAVTAAATALGVLALTSVLIQYPTESVRLVDAGVRTVTGMIATGFSDGKVLPQGAASGDGAVIALDAQMDDINRGTQYRTWADGVFGDPDSAIAKKYGPRVFRSTHFSWAEYSTYRSDPNGVGKEILEAKQAAFKQHAEAIEKADPVAYEHFKGEHWSGRATSALVNLFVVCLPCLFLLLAGLFALMGFVLVRLVVPLAPAAGVIFMFDPTRDMAVGWLKRVVGPLVMGPVCFLVALLLLRFTSAVFEADVVWVIKIAVIAVLTAIAFRLSGVLGMVPGYERARRRIGDGLRQALGTAVGAAVGARDGGEPVYGDKRLGTAARRPSLESSPGGVWSPVFEARAPDLMGLEPPEGFVPYRPPSRALGVGAAGAAGLGSVGVGASAEAVARRALPVGPSIGDGGLREEYQRLPKEKKSKWVPLVGYPSGGSHLEKARFYADKLNDEQLDLPEWQRNVVSGRWFNFATAHMNRASEVPINKYVARTDPVTGVTTMAKDTNYFLDGIGIRGESFSKKFTQIADIKPETWERYVNEFDTKYDSFRPDLLVADTPGTQRAVERGELSPNEINRFLRGRKVLVVPRQHRPIPQSARDYAEEHGVMIQESATHPDAGELS